MKTIKVAEATNKQLDWLVAKCEGHDVGFDAYGVMIERSRVTDRFDPTTNPGWMWPIIERERITTLACDHDWEAQSRAAPLVAVEGPTALIAAARCYVVSKLGEEVEVPDELC